jgi:hypothetical protein
MGGAGHGGAIVRQEDIADTCRVVWFRLLMSKISILSLALCKGRGSSGRGVSRSIECRNKRPALH